MPAEILCSKKTNISPRTEFEGLYASFLEHNISKGNIQTNCSETKTFYCEGPDGGAGFSVIS